VTLIHFGGVARATPNVRMHQSGWDKVPFETMVAGR
jgi:hypothetical protein